MVEITLTDRDGVVEEITARTRVLGGLEVVVNLDLGDWGEFKEMISCINKKSTRVESMGNSVESVGIDKFGKTNLKFTLQQDPVYRNLGDSSYQIDELGTRETTSIRSSNVADFEQFGRNFGEISSRGGELFLTLLLHSSTSTSAVQFLRSQILKESIVACQTRGGESE
ncbi:hypothetical protein JCM5350_006542 [Sporobolomyces pararoseus]